MSSLVYWHRALEVIGADFGDLNSEGMMNGLGTFCVQSLNINVGFPDGFHGVSIGVWPGFVIKKPSGLAVVCATGLILGKRIDHELLMRYGFSCKARLQRALRKGALESQNLNRSYWSVAGGSDCWASGSLVMGPVYHD